MGKNRNNILKKASIISIAGNAVLAFAKIITGIISGSLSVLGDGLDSLTDVFISIITLITSIIISKPPDKEHPFGHYRAETIATSILAFIMLFIGGQLVLSTIEKIMNHSDFEMPGMIAVYVTIFSIVSKLLLSWSQFYFGKKAGSSMLIANGKNMLNDVITSSGVLIVLACVFFFNLPIIDKIIAIMIGLWIVISAIRIYWSTINEMMEGDADKELYKKIFETVKTIEGTGNPHRVRIKKIGALYSIEMDIEVDGNMSVEKAHELTLLIEDKIHSAIDNIYDIVIHTEPLGNFEKEECYGLNEQNMHF
jgi:cation diffusion facilitator family transporter